jgi:hypothetical protein
MVGDSQFPNGTVRAPVSSLEKMLFSSSSKSISWCDGFFNLKNKKMSLLFEMEEEERGRWLGWLALLKEMSMCVRGLAPACWQLTLLSKNDSDGHSSWDFMEAKKKKGK